MAQIRRAACLEAAGWPRQASIAVNVSPPARFLSIVEGALAGSGLAPAWLEVEITESIFVQSSAANRDIVPDDAAPAIPRRATCARFASRKSGSTASLCTNRPGAGSRASIRSIISLAQGMNIPITVDAPQRVWLQSGAGRPARSPTAIGEGPPEHPDPCLNAVAAGHI
ncbi:hypothetical protein ACM0P6_04520 [Komagataeibacter sucrofermentans]|uniref:hypothetical protein n=1 Tax=Komagataeibacter sucrofermentans TaxID=1053551 RepID=UPI001ABEF988|nr:hypothetical protein [Komagataeibacter sucrofermentans]GBQ46373.1 hypothetical protein AA15973_0878 [Komagataeibacter sucrofermentans DSM 15973]